MKQNQFKVEKYSISDCDEKVLVFITKNNKGLTITIPKTKFEAWAMFSGRLEWELNYSVAGEHQQESGQMSFHEYWDSAEHFILVDLYDYIVANPIVFRGITYPNSLDSILPQLNND